MMNFMRALIFLFRNFQTWSATLHSPASCRPNTNAYFETLLTYAGHAHSAINP